MLLVFAKAPDADDSSSALQQSTTFGLFHVSNARMSFAPSRSLADPTTRLRQGHFSGFSPGWYATVGNQIMLTILILTVLPHVQPLFNQLVWRPLRRLCYAKCCAATTQQTLNRMYDGGRFDVAVKYAAMLNMAAVCMLYSAGLPLLYPMACIAFGLAFVVDKLFCESLLVVNAVAVVCVLTESCAHFQSCTCRASHHGTVNCCHGLQRPRFRGCCLHTSSLRAGCSRIPSRWILRQMR